MAFADRLPVIAVGAILVLGVGVLGWRAFKPAESVAIDVAVPKLSRVALAGQAAFDRNCAQCHGRNGAGTNKGPPLIHTIYNPGHHGDQAFAIAARQGVQAHHWAFGNMPAQPQVTTQELIAIVRFIREVQQANGIFYKKHQM
jgi:mono/diheme cytochrome c family protein